MTTNVAELSWLLAPVSSNMPRHALVRAVAAQRERVAGLVVERVAGRGVHVGPQVVLEEVVVVGDAAVGGRRVVRVELRRRRVGLGAVLVAVLAAFPGLREAEVAELVALRVLRAGALAGVEQLAALVEEVADVDHLLDGEPRGAGAGRLARLAGQVVVAEVPDDGVVVAQHAEVVRREVAALVDVVDVVRDAVGVERVGVVGQVARPGRVGIGRVAGRVVLGRQDQHLVAGLRARLVGEVRGGLAGAFEPDLDLVARVGPGDRAAEAVVEEPWLPGRTARRPRRAPS